MIREAEKVVRIAVQALFILCLAVPLTAQTGEWKKYEARDGNFSVLFPVQPKDTTFGGREGIESEHGFSASDGSVQYAVFYASTKEEQKVNEANYETVKTFFFKGLPKCSEVSSTEASPAFPGYMGRGYRLDCDAPNANAPIPKATLIINIYLGRHFMYMIMVGFAATPAPPIVKKFMDSFSVTDIGK